MSTPYQLLFILALTTLTSSCKDTDVNLIPLVQRAACSEGQLTGGDTCYPSTGRSCEAALACGEDRENCCAATIVPAIAEDGGYKMGFDKGGPTQAWASRDIPVEGYQDPGVPTGLESFVLDKYEVTVGRFQYFLDDYDKWRKTNPLPGAGGGLGNGVRLGLSTEDVRNDTIYGIDMPEDAAEIEALFGADACASPQWEQSADNRLVRPVNCIPWHVAALFCIWDGGRLPTEAEWTYAAAGGAEMRPFPWGNAEFTSEMANIGSSAPVQVGTYSRPAAWKQHNLAGNLWEWVFDACEPSMVDGAISRQCQPLTEPGVQLEGPLRVIKGGSYKFGLAQARTAWRWGLEPQEGASNADYAAFEDVGFRCARDVEAN